MWWFVGLDAHLESACYGLGTARGCHIWKTQLREPPPVEEGYGQKTFKEEG